MGLGKSLQALMTIDFYHEELPCLIVCPSSLRFGWRDQALKWLGESGTGLIARCATGKDKLDPAAKVVVCSFDLLKTEKFRRAHDGERYRVVVVDESQFIKSAKSDRTKRVTEICDGAHRVMLLSGTPALNKA
ncbi:unnamed protein product [Amoebophrya sp. A25]|nr:unnamed protein product [Amoebophrya sp. A25]|eukprot:GSA25T00000058001.1